MIEKKKQKKRVLPIFYYRESVLLAINVLLHSLPQSSLRSSKLPKKYFVANSRARELFQDKQGLKLTVASGKFAT